MADADNALRAEIDKVRERAREAQRGEALVDREVARHLARQGDQEIIPTIVSLRERLEDIRQAEVRRALARLPDASAETRATIEALSSAIVNKILHAPITRLKQHDHRSEAFYIDATRRLFDLEAADDS